MMPQTNAVPKYYGPSLLRLTHLLLLMIVNSIVLLILSILLLRAVWMLAQNQTTIEGWEIERHQTLVRRAKVFGGFLGGPDGMQIRIRKQEFPFDIGIWSNMRDGMGGTSNVHLVESLTHSFAYLWSGTYRFNFIKICRYSCGSSHLPLRRLSAQAWTSK